MENEIKDFWQMHPCGAELVGDLNEETRAEYADFFARYDAFRYAKEPHILTNLDRIDFAGKRVLEIGLGQGADGEQIVRRGGIYSGADLTDESVKRVKMRFSLHDLSFDRIEQASALELPFDDNSFDIVFSHGVLHHIPEIKKAQAALARVLKPDGKLIVMLYAKWSLNYLVSICVARRLGLLAMYGLGLRPGGIYGDHIANVKKTGIWKYLAMDNFINVSTDGPFNPYSKVYEASEIAQDFTDFEVVETHKEFMHAPPLPVGWLPLAGILGWHLWATMKKRN
ncbi:MAG TPA: class I SAM-dependent methyltransferase [Pyrinomonadaceae bacterium]|nr:class I SAM-dependent methyltransferase [Pyrinomonadaceae bacterium]